MTQAARNITGIFLLTTCVVFAGCSANEFAPQYAISKLDLPNGKAIYFKREVRGLVGNYDVIAISPNGDPCVSFNRDTDYGLRSDGQSVYYKLEGDTLHFYYATPTGTPKSGVFPVKVVNHEIDIMKVEEFKRMYPKDGITRLDLPVDDAHKCG